MNLTTLAFTSSRVYAGDFITNVQKSPLASPRVKQQSDSTNELTARSTSLHDLFENSISGNDKVELYHSREISGTKHVICSNNYGEDD